MDQIQELGSQYPVGRAAALLWEMFLSHGLFIGRIFSHLSTDVGLN